MPSIKKVLRRNRLINDLMNELSIIKIWKRNYSYRPIIKKWAAEAEVLLSERSKNKDCVFFVGIPTHMNMGDQAQKFCIEKWIKENYPQHQVIMIPTWPFYDSGFRAKLKDCVKPYDIFVIQSGYCTTSSHIDHYMHRYIVESYDNPVLIMPQTIMYNRKTDPPKTARIYAKHKKLLLLTRDNKSYHDAKIYFRHTEILNYPDIVTSLIGDSEFQTNAKRDGILICVRDDDEKKYSNAQISEIAKYFNGKGIYCDVSDTNSNLSLSDLNQRFESELNKLICYFGSHQVVITDRYHGTIFSMISNTPVIVLATLDHKVKTGTEWFKNIYDDAFYNADSIDEAISLAEKVLGERKEIRNSSYFKDEYYEKLKDRFERIAK